MRKILFRGIIKEECKHKGKWAFGNLVYDGNTNTYWIQQFNYTFDTGSFEVDPETVGQFTGLLDKNGKQIFEGDILRYERENHHNPYDPFIELSSVEFKHGGFYLIPDEECLYSGECIEVIGNVHDNPELLEEKK